MTDKTYSSKPAVKDDYTQDPRRNVEFSHAPRSFGRWVAWIVVLLIAADVLWGVSQNKNFEWHVVAQWFLEGSVIKGLGVTLGLTVVSMLLGVFIGLMLAIARLSDSLLLRQLAGLYIWFFRNAAAGAAAVLVQHVDVIPARRTWRSVWPGIHEL